MRKISIALIFTFFISQSAYIVYAAPAPKPGASCNKVGKSTNYKNKKFTCIRLGKKLVWDKGISIPSNEVKKTESPTEVKPSPQATPKVSYPELSRAEAGVYTELDNQISLWLNTQLPAYTYEINVISDNPDHPRIEPNLVAARKSAQVLNFYSPKIPQFDIYAWEKTDWIKEKLIVLCPNMIQSINPNAGAGVGCFKVFVTNLKGWHNVNSPVYGSWFESAHEMFHMGQNYWAQDLQDSQRTNSYENTPAWYREGSASTFGGMIASLLSEGKRNFGDSTKFEQSPIKFQECKAAWEYWRTSNQTQGFGFFNGCEYGLGRRMTDLLVARHGGIKAMFNFYSELAKRSDFETAFKFAHGLTTQNFFDECEIYFDQLGWKS